MNKKIFTLAAFLLTAGLYTAQQHYKMPTSQTQIKKVNIHPVQEEEPAILPITNNVAQITTSSPQTNIAPPYKKISSSSALLTAIMSQSNCLQYHKDLNIVSFVHRQSPFWTFSGSNSGNMQMTYTSNNGATWDSIVFGLCNGGSTRYRYPSGAIFNPGGNTQVQNAFAVGAGPITDGANWTGNYFSSGQLNGTNINTQDLQNGTGSWPTAHFYRNSFSFAGNNAYVIGQLALAPNGTTSATYGYRGISSARGTFNSGTQSFDWTFDTLNITNAFQYTSSLNDAYISYGTGNNYIASQVWSDNAVIGYRIFYGVSSAATTPGSRSYQPIVYKTVDGGVTWNAYQHGFDWSSIPVFQNLLLSYDGTHIKPFFSPDNGMDASVDKNGDLHIACGISSGSSDHQDSLNYQYVTQPVYIFDCWTNANGWNAELIDSLQANASHNEVIVPWADQTTSPITPYNNDARIQISRSVNGDKLFFIWADTDVSSLSFPINIQPYICAKGVDVDTRCQTTKKTFYANNQWAYFHYASPLAMSPNTTSYTIPVSYVNSNNGTYNALATVDHYYMDDVNFADADFTICSPPSCLANFAMWQDTVTPTIWYGNNNSSGNNLSYLWDFGDGNTSTSATPTHNYAVTGYYNICLTVTDASGNCTDTYCDSVGALRVAAGSGISTLIILGITTDADQNAIEFNSEFYPNPASNQITLSITCGNAAAIQLRITDMTGRLVKQEQMNATAGKSAIPIDISTLAKGMYYFDLSNGNKPLKKVRIIKY